MQKSFFILDESNEVFSFGALKLLHTFIYLLKYVCFVTFIYYVNKVYCGDTMVQ